MAIVIVILIVALVTIHLGYSPPDVIMFALGAGLAGARVAREALPDPAQGELR